MRTGRRRGLVALDRALSKLGLASRTEARRLIEAGCVEIDGRVIVDPRTMVVPERASLRIRGTTAAPAARLVVALHKPRGVVTTRSDPEGRPTVYSLLEDLGTHVVPIGRLDLATSGLLLLTNDTRFADWLADPQSAVPRVYLVTARGQRHGRGGRTPRPWCGEQGRASGRAVRRAPQGLVPRIAPGGDAHRGPEPRSPPSFRGHRPRGDPPSPRAGRRARTGLACAPRLARDWRGRVEPRLPRLPQAAAAPHLIAPAAPVRTHPHLIAPARTYR